MSDSCVRNNLGMSLVEVMVTIVILGLGLLGLAPFLVIAIDANSISRDAMVASLNHGDVDLDFRIQRQTDPHLMPIENAGVLWPERLSPRISAATLHIPRQRFASSGQIAFARRLSYNPWHCIAEHRPLGNQSRARRRMYWEVSQLRHDMNQVQRYEPTGDETFD